jgi:hypothetical protein
MAKKKDKKKVEEIKIEEYIPEPEPEPIPEPPPEPVFVPWRAKTFENTEQVIGLFNDLENSGYVVTEYDIEYNQRRGTIDVVYKVIKAV